jgi:hypothetical protein
MKSAVFALSLLAVSSNLFAQTSVVPPPVPPEMERKLAELPADTQVYERFRY